jgi:adenosylmethionine-8-amino-7-oxononanoate aminotransferase
MPPLSNLAARDVETLVHPYVNLAHFREAEEEGLIVRSVMGDVLTLSPPLVIKAPEIEELFNRLTRALDKTLDWVTREGFTQA